MYFWRKIITELDYVFCKQNLKKEAKIFYFWYIDGYEQGMMMENGLSPDYDDPAMYGNANSEYMMAAHYAQGG